MATDVAWSAISDGLTLVVNLTSFLLLFRSLEIETYGGYVGVYGVIGPLGALTFSGMSLLILQRIIREKEDPQEVFFRTFGLTLLQGAVATTLAFLIGREVISVLDSTTILLMAIAELLVFPVSQTVTMMVQAVRGFAASARFKIFIPLVRFAALIACWATGNLTVRNLAIAWIIGFTLTGLVAIRAVVPALGLRVGVRKAPASYLRGNLELALPLFSSNLQQNGDKAVMNRFGFEQDAGFYGAAFRVIMLAQMPIRTMNQALFQRFLPTGDDDRGLHLRRAQRFASVSLPLSLSIAVIIYFTAPLLGFLVDDIDTSISMIRWLLPVVPLFSISRAPLNGLLGLGRTTLRAGIILSSSLLSMTLYLSLIPSMSWRGAVIGTIVSELYLTAVSWFMLWRAQRAADASADVAESLGQLSVDLD